MHVDFVPAFGRNSPLKRHRRWRRQFVTGLVGLGVALAMAFAAPPAAKTQEMADKDWLAELRTYEAKREKRGRPDDVMAALGVRPGARVADIGAGDGFYTVRLAQRVGATGRVFAVDVSERAIGKLRERVSREGLTNVEVIQGGTDDPRLSGQSLDAVLIVNAYHEMPQHQAILRQVRAALVPDGRLVIMEPLDTTLRQHTREQQEKKHSLAPGHVLADLRAAGFGVATLEDPFTRQGIIDEEWLIVAQPLADYTPSMSTSPNLTQSASFGIRTAASTTPGAAPAAVVDQVDDRFSPRHRVAFDAFQKLYDSGEVLIVDVRDADSYREGHIPGALLVPYDKIEAHVERLRAETRPIVAYCACPAEETSGAAVVNLAKHGITNVRAMVGGYRLWVAKEQPVVKGDSPCDGPTCPLKGKKENKTALSLTPLGSGTRSALP